MVASLPKQYFFTRNRSFTTLWSFVCILPESVYVFNILQIFLKNLFQHFANIFHEKRLITWCYIQNYHTFIWCHEISIHCCKLTVGVALNMRYTTNGICAKNNTKNYGAWRSNHRVIMACDLYCRLLPQCEALRTCHSDFPIATKWCCDRMWMSCQAQPSQKERVIGAVRCKKEVMLLQPLHWCCAECAVHHKRNVRKE